MAECSEGRKVNTLEDSLKQFNMDSLLQQLDTILERVRRNKLTEKELSDFVKSEDKRLLKLSLTHHPDKAINEKKSDREIADAKSRQIALNATRTVLRALTKAFLEDIDMHYRYEFFSKTDTSSLINEKEMDNQINYVLCKISHLSEEKRVNIVGEIRKFLLKSRESLRNFHADNRDEFERHRDHALFYLHRCVEGYASFITECELVVEECESENDENTRKVMQEITVRGVTELNILKKLEKVADRSLEGTFQIFSNYEPEDKYDYYLVSPLVFYVNVMLMCSSVVNRKSGVWRKFEKFKMYCLRFADETPYFDKEPALFLKAYHLACYFSNGTLYEREVASILLKKGLDTTPENIITEFKGAVKNIEAFLVEEFNIETYKEGKTNREQFNDKLSKLSESLTLCKTAEKDLLEKFNFCKKETDEVRKKCVEISEKILEDEQESQDNILKSMNRREDITEFLSKRNQEKDTRNGNFNQNFDHADESCDGAKNDGSGVKLITVLEQNEDTAINLLDGLADISAQNITKIEEHQLSIDSQIDCPLVSEGGGKKIKASYQLNQKTGEQLCYSTSPTPLKTTKQVNLPEANFKESSPTKLNYVSIVDKTLKSSDIYEARTSTFGENVTKMIEMSPSIQRKDCEDLQKIRNVEESVDTSMNGKLKGIFDDEGCSKMAKSHILSREEDAKGESKTLRPIILNENNQNVKCENKNREGRIVIHLPVGSISSDCPAEEIAEECEEHFQNMNPRSSVKSDESLEEDGKGMDSMKERKHENSKNQCREERFGDSSAL